MCSQWMDDRRNRQTSTTTPAEPGDLPWVLGKQDAWNNRAPLDYFLTPARQAPRAGPGGTTSRVDTCQPACRQASGTQSRMISNRHQIKNRATSGQIQTQGNA